MEQVKKIISWKETEPDIKINTLQELILRFGLVDSILLNTLSKQGTIVLATNYVKNKIRKHLTQKKIEMGGLLVGHVYSLQNENGISYATVIKNSIPSLEFKSTTVSLNLGTDVWNSARPYLDKGYMVVGWYHSHPGFGAFFSSTDRDTQKHFFKEPYHVGLVMDPFRKEEKWFLGKDSIEVKYRFNY